MRIAKRGGTRREALGGGSREHKRGLILGRVGPLVQKGQDRGTQSEGVPADQTRMVDSLFTKKGAFGRAHVLHGETEAVFEDPGMKVGDVRVGQNQVGVGRASDDRGVAIQGKDLLFPTCFRDDQDRALRASRHTATHGELGKAERLVCGSFVVVAFPAHGLCPASSCPSKENGAATTLPEQAGSLGMAAPWQ